MGPGKKFWVGALGVVLSASAHAAKAQDAKQIVQEAVNTQLAADRNDHTHWRYIRPTTAKTRSWWWRPRTARSSGISK